MHCKLIHVQCMGLRFRLGSCTHPVFPSRLYFEHLIPTVSSLEKSIFTRSCCMEVLCKLPKAEECSELVSEV